MTPGEAGAALIRRLLAEISADRKALSARRSELAGFLADDATPPATRAAAVALVLDRSYAGLESSLDGLSVHAERGSEPPEVSPPDGS